MIKNNVMVTHCRGLYLREFAHNTVPTIDPKYGNEPLPDLRRVKYKPISSDIDLSYALKRYSNRPGNYITVYSFEKLTKKKTIDYSSAKINRIYLDFDNKTNPQMAINEALFTIKSLVKRAIFPHCYFSGGKGIAMYIDFITTEVKPENKKEVIAAFFDLVKGAVAQDYENFFGLWIKSTGAGFEAVLETLDHQVRGDIARVSRIPNTKHKSGLYCIPLSFGEMWCGIERIKQLATEMSEKDLDKTISYTMMRNETMPVIIRNLEKEVIKNKFHNQMIKETKQKQQEMINMMRPKRKRPLSDEDIQTARNTSLSQLISHENRMRCPIHGGDNPTSFYIDHKKNYWFCHSCGRGGNAITYLMEKEHMDFKTAVITLVGAPAPGAAHE